MSFPVQFLPWYLGAGLSQTLVLEELQSVLHTDHSLHNPQFPSIGLSEDTEYYIYLFISYLQQDFSKILLFDSVSTYKNVVLSKPSSWMQVNLKMKFSYFLICSISLSLHLPTHTVSVLLWIWRHYIQGMARNNTFHSLVLCQCHASMNSYNFAMF